MRQALHNMRRTVTQRSWHTELVILAVVLTLLLLFAAARALGMPV